MLRMLLIISILLTSNTSWAVNWDACHQQLDELRKVNKVGNLATASSQAVKLQDLYDGIQNKRFEYDQCKTSADATMYCADKQRRMNALIYDYKIEKDNFKNQLLSSGKYMQSKNEPCGFKLER